MKLREKRGQTNTITILGIAVIVAIVFTGVGYSLAPTTLTTNQVKEYMSDASQDEIREILETIPQEIIRGEVEVKYPMVIEDDLGREVIIEDVPETIVSLSPSITEILFALELDNEVVGVSEACDYPPEVNELLEKDEIEIAGPYAQPLVSEVIVDIDPDIVISAAGTPMDSINELEDIGVTFVGVESEDIAGVLETIELIGEITDTTEEAQEITGEMESEIDKITEITDTIPGENKPKVYYEIWELWTFGPETFGHEMIEKAGGVNVAENEGDKYPMLKEEILLEKNPEIFITGTDVRPSTGSVENDYPGIKAVEKDQVYLLEDEIRDIVSRPGPRITEAMKEMVKLLHPELELPT